MSRNGIAGSYGADTFFEGLLNSLCLGEGTGPSSIPGEGSDFSWDFAGADRFPEKGNVVQGH